MFFITGTYFLLYDFLDYFEKDGPSFLQREKFLEIVDTIFKEFSKIKREAIVFQVSIFKAFIILLLLNRHLVPCCIFYSLSAIIYILHCLLHNFFIF